MDAGDPQATRSTPVNPTSAYVARASSQNLKGLVFKFTVYSLICILQRVVGVSEMRG